MDMKKVLLGTTALVAATAVASGDASAADKMKYSLGGYWENTIGVTSIDDDQDTAVPTAGVASTNVNDEGINQYQDAEVFFQGSTKLDNGITISVDAQMELTSADTTDRIDESYMTISGDFGKVIWGSENLPNYKMGYGEPSVSQAGITSSDYSTFYGNPTGNSQFNTSYFNVQGRFYHNDSMMFSYYTPRISGLQAGVGFAPDTNEGNGTSNSSFENGLSWALNWVHDVAGFNVAASAGSMHWFEVPAVVSNGTTGANEGSATSYNFGLNIGAGGWTVGGGFAFSNYNHGSDLTTSSDAHTWTLGARYKTGPWGVSLAYAHAQSEGTGFVNLGDDEGDRLELAGSYDLGPGVRWHAGLLWADEEGEDLGPSDDAEAVVLITGLKLSF